MLPYVNVNRNTRLAFWMCRAQKVNSVPISISSPSKESLDVTGGKNCILGLFEP